MLVRTCVATIGLTLLSAADAWAGEFGSPVQCAIGTDCFVQQYPDLLQGAGSSDPFCGVATYDGHTGIDIRVPSMADAGRGVAVLAVADGTVLRVREGVADRLVVTDADRAAVQDTECGNGVVLEHGDGYETQICHLQEGSVRATPGERVSKGAVLGFIGASGLAQFPHVHLTVRRDGTTVDPITGRTLDAGCDSAGSLSATVFEPSVAEILKPSGPQVIAIGMADHAVTDAELMLDDDLSPPAVTAPAHVGWASFINLSAGDELIVELRAPDGSVVAEQRIPPLDRSKATYLAFAGKKRAPVAGDYRVVATVLRSGAAIARQERSITVR